MVHSFVGNPQPRIYQFVDSMEQPGTQKNMANLDERIVKNVDEDKNAEGVEENTKRGNTDDVEKKTKNMERSNPGEMELEMGIPKAGDSQKFGTVGRNFKERAVENFTTVIHVLALGFVLFIVYCATLEPFVLFTWHPVLYAIGVSF